MGILPRFPGSVGFPGPRGGDISLVDPAVAPHGIPQSGESRPANRAACTSIYHLFRDVCRRFSVHRSRRHQSARRGRQRAGNGDKKRVEAKQLPVKVRSGNLAGTAATRGASLTHLVCLAFIIAVSIAVPSEETVLHSHRVAPNAINTEIEEQALRVGEAQVCSYHE